MQRRYDGWHAGVINLGEELGTHNVDSSIIRAMAGDVAHPLEVMSWWFWNYHAYLTMVSYGVLIVLVQVIYGLRKITLGHP